MDSTPSPDPTAPAPAAAPSGAAPSGAAPSAAALSTPAYVEELADQLTRSADALHARLMKSIRTHDGDPISEAEQAVARMLLDDEQVLRQRANGLYADAARYVVDALGPSQQVLVALTTDAAQKIAKIERLRDISGLVGGLLMLGSAAMTGNLAPIVVALERVSKQMKRVAASKPGSSA